MRTLLSALLIIFLAGALHAQDAAISPVGTESDLTGTLARMQGSADLLLVSSIAEGIGLVGLGVSLYGASDRGYSRSTEFSFISGIAYAGLAPLGYIVSSIAYGTLLDSYNRINPNDKQYAAPYVLLTIGGTLLTSIGVIASFLESNIQHELIGLTDSQAEQASRELQATRDVLLGISLVGIAASLSGIVVSVVHSQELLAKTKSATKKAVSAPIRQIIVTPQIGIGSFGVAISM